MPGYGIASLSVTEQNTLIQRVKNIDPYYSSEVARAFLDQFHYPLENRFSDYQSMLQAVEQSGAGMSLSLIEPGKKDAAGYHSIDLLLNKNRTFFRHFLGSVLYYLV